MKGSAEKFSDVKTEEGSQKDSRPVEEQFESEHGEGTSSQFDAYDE